MHGHISKLAGAQRAGLERAGIKADLYQYIFCKFPKEIAKNLLLESQKLFLEIS